MLSQLSKNLEEHIFRDSATSFLPQIPKPSKSRKQRREREESLGVLSPAAKEKITRGGEIEKRSCASESFVWDDEAYIAALVLFDLILGNIFRRRWNFDWSRVSRARRLLMAGRLMCTIKLLVCGARRLMDWSVMRLSLRKLTRECVWQWLTLERRFHFKRINTISKVVRDFPPRGRSLRCAERLTRLTCVLTGISANCSLLHREDVGAAYP